MRGNLLLNTFLRLAVIWALQVFVLSRVGSGESWASELQILLYPLVILLLPIDLPSVFVLMIAFVFGLSIDITLGSIGIHTAALLVTGYSRSLVLTILEPRDGYQVGEYPTRAAFGWSWFSRYIAILMLLHCLVYFSIDAFSFVFIGSILLRTLIGFAASFLLILMYTLIFDPRV